MRRTRLLPLFLVPGLMSLAFGSLAAQVPTPPPADSAAVVAGADTLQVSARGALLRSIALPGWGQAYVGAPGRGAIYFGMEAGSVWMVLKSRRELAAARALEASLVDPSSTEDPPELPLARARRQQVEDWVTLSVFLLFFSGADAYVAAQLSDFSQHIGIIPGEDGSARLEVSVPIGRGR